MSSPLRKPKMEAQAPARVKETAKQKLERYRSAAKSRPVEEWGDQEEMAKEAVEVHKAFAQARDRANKSEF